MERKEIKRLKERLQPILEEGRHFFGKELYDAHIKDVLNYFGMDINNKEIKEIFDL